MSLYNCLIQNHENFTNSYPLSSLVLYIKLFAKVNFEMFFDQLFADTGVDKLPDDQRIIVRAPTYFEQLNSLLIDDPIFTKEGLGKKT